MTQLHDWHDAIDRERGTLTPNELAVLQALATFADDNGEAHPSVREISEVARVAMPRTRLVLGRVERKSWLVRRPGGGACASSYQLTAPTTRRSEP